MRIHGNARLTVHARRVLCARVLEEGVSVSAAALQFGVSERTVFKWLARFRAEGDAGLWDRSCAPHRVPNRTSPACERLIRGLRQLRMTGAEIAECLGMALSTVSAVLRRIGLGKRSRLEPTEPPNRYQRRHPGELVHIDVKKLGRIPEGGGHRIHGRGAGKPRGTRIGWDAVHVCVDDATRLAYVEVLDDERATNAAAFLRRAIAHFAARGVEIQAIMTDNGAPYVSTLHAQTCAQLGIRHLRTRPYRPRTNGKAERFIQTMLNGWAYAAAYHNTAHRNAALGTWVDFYNHHRPHGSLSKQAPATRLAELLNNPAGNYT
jgi:transposase InsO family protein